MLPVYNQVLDKDLETPQRQAREGEKMERERGREGEKIEREKGEREMFPVVVYTRAERGLVSRKRLWPCL